jgi:hypothetical protein
MLSIIFAAQARRAFRTAVENGSVTAIAGEFQGGDHEFRKD